MLECFGVFLKVIALVGIGSECAAVRTLLPLHRRIGAYTALARAKEVEEASIARLAPPTSRRGITEQWEFSVPLQRPERLVNDHPKRLPRVDSTWQAQPARRGEPVSCGIQEPLHCWNPRYAPIPTVTQTGQTTKPTRAEFVGANRLFARLVLHQVRPRDRSAAAGKQRIGSSPTKPGSVSVAAPDAGSSSTPIETLFSELVRRRLRRLVAKERPE
ncbi:MAG: hypothetical protein DMG57_39435 [Acidobacteria bacterium]|nr:MAG: hypothetical protein DMG57_39435 [Acidobacteriota bacterium]